MRFDLTDLQLFLNVHEAGSITAGAQRSHMTLASASERIRGMERVLGVALLSRGHRGVAVTPAGQTLLHHARLVSAQVERMRGDLAQYGEGLKGHVRLWCNTVALSEYLPPLLGGFLLRHPSVSVALQERSSPLIAEALRSGECDMGIVSDAVDLDDFECFAFRHDPLSLIVHKGHALAVRREVFLAEVGAESFVGLGEDSALQVLVAQQARRLGLALDYRIHLGNFDAVCALVAQGVGIAIVPRVVAQRCVRDLPIVTLALSDAWADRQLFLCVRPRAELALHARRLVDHLLSEGS
ncbi:LysR family transcriptional regulator [Pseudomonas sp. ABC1]|uniref:LysR substrate-binding domain-containing protein n=1 Tax=Pseudomonas sp. ABC1 TaxID=2748080 RepID=UPI0015C3F0BD|nr:LysR substrate-binding domain-containing protein [Pseudomonas sp. ABC1]QLF93641.1 LysR family transcriptional regulator [Pseudomonas sp. ABC1]